LHKSSPAIFHVDDIETDLITKTVGQNVARVLMGSRFTFPKDVPAFEAHEIVTGKCLGRGGFSNVFELMQVCCDASKSDCRGFSENSRKFIAKHCLRGKGDARYVIKRLRQDSSDFRDASTEEMYYLSLADLIVETRFLHHLEHPNIVKLRGISQSSIAHGDCDYFLVLDRLFVTMEKQLVVWKQKAKKAKSILGRILNPKKRNELLQDRLAIAIDLCSAIEYLHDSRVIHRDVKPDNIGFDVVRKNMFVVGA
jgi:serine/threonine protein kinase